MGAKPVMSRRPNLPIVLVVVAVCSSLGALARAPHRSTAEIERLAQPFRFSLHTLPPIPIPVGGVTFPVNKTAEHMQFYFYQVGASAALGDADGDGLPNDLCMTDVRSKSAMVSPVPGTGGRFTPFVLEFGKLFDRTTEYPSVCRFADMNEDGLEDIFVGFYGRPPLLLLRKAGAGVTRETPLSMDQFVVAELVPGLEQRWWTSTATFADIDGDGHQDLIVGNYYADGAELTDATSSQPFEMNSDFSRARNGGHTRIFRATGRTSGHAPGVTYADAGDVLPDGGGTAWTLAIGAADLDRDGLSDLYIANDFGPDELLWNRSTPGHVKLTALHGRSGFFTPESMVIGKDSFKGMGIDFGDINGDGVFDMFVSNIASPFALQESHFLWTSTGGGKVSGSGGAPWVDRAEESGVAHSAWAWDTRFEDFDNGGKLQLVQATGLVRGQVNRWADFAQLGGSNDVFVKYPAVWPHFKEGSDLDGTERKPFYVERAKGEYTDVSSVLFPELTEPSRGIAVGDVEGRGFPSMVFANFWADSVYLKNESSGNQFLGLHLLQPILGAPNARNETMQVHDGHPRWREGTAAIGAFVEIELPDGRKQIREVDGGNGHSGQRSPEVRFGLGKFGGKAVVTRITWRDMGGTLHHDQLSLAPGYHTILLGAQGGAL